MKRDLIIAIFHMALGLVTFFGSAYAGFDGGDWNEAIYLLLIGLWNFHQVDRHLDERVRQYVPRDVHVHIDGGDVPQGVTYLANKRRDGGL